MCPGAPLLIPGLADVLAGEVAELVTACHRAIFELEDVDRVLLLSSGPGARDEWQRRQRISVVQPAGALVSSALLTGGSAAAHFTGRLAGKTTAQALAVSPQVDRTAPSAQAIAPPAGVGVIVGAALLAAAGIGVPVTAVELADPTAEVTDLLDDVRTSADRVGLLVVAEGSASRGSRSPGGGSTDADSLDAALAGALAAGDPAALAAAAGVGPSEAARLLFTSGPALSTLAELTKPEPPDRAAVLLDQAPLGVGYLVAVWSWSR